MRAKLSLNLDDLSVESFDTIATQKAKGTVFGEQCTCQTVCTCPGCPTCDATCPNTCPASCYGTCHSCPDTCWEESCACTPSKYTDCPDICW